PPLRRLRLRRPRPEERQPLTPPRRRGHPPGRQRGAHRRVAGGARVPRGRSLRRSPRDRRRWSRAGGGVRRRRLPASHLARAGPASPYARERRQHGPPPQRREVAGRRRGRPPPQPPPPPPAPPPTPPPPPT